MPPKKIALLIGINYLHTSAQLSGCLTDVAKIKALLKRRCHFAENEIRVLTNGQATRQAILRELGRLQSFDQIFFHYSGHGSYVRDVSGDERDHKDEVIVPNDYKTHGMITDDQLHRCLVALPATTQGIFMFDACHSGTVLDLRYRYVPERKSIVENRKSKVAARVVMVSGCHDAQVSMEAVLAGKSAGAMTWAFISALENVKSTIQLAKLITKMRQLLRKNGFDQTPHLSGSRKLFSKYEFLVSTATIDYLKP